MNTSYRIPFQRRLSSLVLLGILALSTASFTPATAQTSPPANTTNPTLPSTCGLDIALVVDSSASIGELALLQMKGAFGDFVDAFMPATPTMMSLTEFATTAFVRQAFTDDGDLIKFALLPAASGGSTNWDDALVKAGSTFDPRPTKPNLILFASDGNPNKYGPTGLPSSGLDEATALSEAIARANDLKAAGTRIVVLGLGDNLNVDNLKAISGPNVNTGVTSDVITTDFSSMADVLSTFAAQLCGGKILVQKQLDTDNNGTIDLTGSAADARLAGWEFTAASAAVTAPAQTTGSTGSLEFSLQNGTYSLTESSAAVSSDLTSMSCEKNEQALGTFNVAARQITGLTLGTDETISCTVVNTLVTRTGSVAGVKFNDVNGNGIVDTGEPGIQGVTVTLSTGPTTTTAADGSFAFASVPVGNVTVTETVPAGWYNTTPAAVSLAVVEGQTATALFGNRQIVRTLSLAKSASVTTLAPTQTIRYTMDWSVAGNQPVTGLLLTDVLPANTTFESVEDSGTYDGATMTVSWNLGTQNPGASGSVHFTVRVASTTPNDTVITNTATLDSAETDPITGSVAVTVRIPSVPSTPVVAPQVLPQVLGETASPSLTIEKTAAVKFVNRGSTLRYTVTVKNTGDATATNVKIVDRLPAEFTFTVGGARERTFTVGSLNAGESRSLTYSVEIGSNAPAGNHKNLATASATDVKPVSDEATVGVRTVQVLGETGIGFGDKSLWIGSAIALLLGFWVFRSARQLTKE